MSTYHVEPGQAPVSFSLGDDLTCTKISLGRMNNNGYLIAGADGPVLWIDAAAQADRIAEVLGHHELVTVVTTHRHPDHIGATAAVMTAAGADGVCGEPDRAAIEQATGTEQRGVWDGDTLPIGRGTIEVIGLVGHTPGSIALAYSPTEGPSHVFTGDSLFPGGVGKTGSPADFASLLDDVTAKIFDRFGDDTLVHPGHGDSTVLGAERGQLGEWRARGW